MKKTTKKNTKKKQVEYKKSVIVTMCILVLAIGIMLGAMVYRYSNGDSILDIKSSSHDIKNYLSVTNTIRKFSNKDYTIIFSPYGYDLRKNKDYYLLIDTSNLENVTSSYGTYTQESNHISLDNGEKLFISDDGLSFKGTNLNIDKENVNYYTYKDDFSKYLLIQNTKKNVNYILYLNTRKNSITVINDSYTESDDYITLSDGTIFTKASDGSHITYNSVQMNLSK